MARLLYPRVNRQLAQAGLWQTVYLGLCFRIESSRAYAAFARTIARGEKANVDAFEYFLSEYRGSRLVVRRADKLKSW